MRFRDRLKLGGCRRHLLPIAVAANTIGFGLLLILSQMIGEASWLTMLLAYIPQAIYAIPSLLLVVWAAVARKPKVALGQFILLLLVCVSLMGFRLNGGQRGEKLRVMTFNIQMGRHGMDRVIAAIREQNPDVFCLQECNSTNDSIQQAVREAMPEYGVVTMRGLLIGSRLPILSRRAVPLLPGPNERPILEAVVAWKGTALRVASVHLTPVFIDHLLLENPGKLPSHLREAGRRHEDEFKKLVAYGKSDPRPLILCGDFNAPAIGPLHRRLCETLTDSFDAAGTGFGYTIPAGFPLLRLDYVYSSHGMKPAAAWVPGRIASDHRAVVAELVASN